MIISTLKSGKGALLGKSEVVPMGETPFSPETFSPVTFSPVTFFP